MRSWAWDLWFGIIGLGSLAWDLWFETFGLASLAWDLWLGIFGPGSLEPIAVPDGLFGSNLISAGGTG